MIDVTRILDRVQQGDPKAAEELFPLIYEELRKLAARKISNEAAGQTLQPTGKWRKQAPAARTVRKSFLPFEKKLKGFVGPVFLFKFDIKSHAASIGA